MGLFLIIFVIGIFLVFSTLLWCCVTVAARADREIENCLKNEHNSQENVGFT